MKNANPVSRRCAALLWVFVALGGGCGGTERAVPPAPRPAATVEDFFPIRVGAQTVRMQLAVRPVEMQRGLMGRRDLGPHDGMLFVYEREQGMRFWMRNTPTPLDIGFFDSAGVLQEIHPLYPFDERTVGARGQRLRFALEVNQGWYHKNGVKPGASLDRAALAMALRARGFEPSRYGLD